MIAEGNSKLSSVSVQIEFVVFRGIIFLRKNKMNGRRFPLAALLLVVVVPLRLVVVEELPLQPKKRRKRRRRRR